MMSEQLQVFELLAKAEKALREHRIADPKRDARLLLQHSLDVSHARLIAMNGEYVGIAQQRHFQEAIARRSNGEPVHRILGCREFFGRMFELSRDTLIPRPETELLVEAGIELLAGSNKSAQILEIGVGSGAIAVSLACALPDSKILATDISDDALATAQKNSVRWSVDDRIEFVHSDLFENVSGVFDLIVSNPPYIPRDVIAGLDREVRDHDPLRALDGGSDGLDFYAAIFSHGRNYLCENGCILVEFGFGQLTALTMLANEFHLEIVNVLNDLSGIERVMTLRKIR